MGRSVEDMSVLVTGGGSGLGEAVVHRLTTAGARVTLSGRHTDKVAAVATAAGPNAHGVVGDVTLRHDRLIARR